ncbi:MAG TPA: hypothetical protein VJT15_12265 [Pyrinomonadaceae bacterium]|nr:hypothetical protein [Pyrinomonadaceae bacterium]
MLSTDLDLSSLSANERKEAEDSAQIIHALAMKALLHRLDPKAFPASGDAGSPEAEVIKLVQTLKSKPLAKLRPLIENRRDQAVEFSRVIKAAGLKLNGLAQNNQEEDHPMSGDIQISSFNRVNLVVRALHCLDETNPEIGSDDMILAGVLIGASGNTNIAHTIIRGGFDDGERVEFQSPQRDFGSFSLTSTPSYPKSFFAIFKLHESDGDDADVAAGLEFMLRLYSQAARAQHQSAPLSIRAFRVANSTQAALNLWYSPPAFSPCGIVLNLNSQNQFGGAQSGNLRTGNIRGHGGTYRIGYKWRLS